MQTELDFSPGRTRNPDHPTSIEGAKSIGYRAGSQKARLLSVYQRAEEAARLWATDPGLTDEEAAGMANLTRTCYWKRCGELRADGKIVPTGETRLGNAGVPRIVCRLA